MDDLSYELVFCPVIEHVMNFFRLVSVFVIFFAKYLSERKTKLSVLLNLNNAEKRQIMSFLFYTFNFIYFINWGQDNKEMFA